MFRIFQDHGKKRRSSECFIFAHLSSLTASIILALAIARLFNDEERFRIQIICGIIISI